MAQDGKKNLGRGLSALLGEESDPPAPGPESHRGPQTLPIEFLRPGRYQPRKSMDEGEIEDLADSIRGKGILQPILVRKQDGEEDVYEIIAGERRWRAAQRAQLHEVPVIVRELGDSEALEIALVENLQRENLSSMDEAEAYGKLMDEFSHTQEGLADSLGKSRSHIANTLRLLNLPDVVKEQLRGGQLSAGHARALLGADDPAALAKSVIRRGLNVRQTEKLVKKAQSPMEGAPPKPGKDPDTLALERDLAALIGLRVDIDFKGKGGRLTLFYDHLEQLDDILHRLSQGSIGTVPPEAPEDPLSPGVEEDAGETAGQLPDDIDDAIRQLEAGAALDADELADDMEAEGFDADFSLSDDDLSALVEATPLDEETPDEGTPPAEKED